jgi:protein-S-isoprenylcysteine O-methyltransferase Ste14
MWWRQLRAILVAPFVVTVVVPFVILFGRDFPDVAALWWVLAGVAGVLLAGCGLFLIGWTISLFDRVGEGTLAPFDPPRHLVLRGPYRYVRNPMISGVLFVLLGESVGFLSGPMLLWFAFFLALNCTYIPLYEEPGLRRRFGEEYMEYRAHVPRWVPRVRPWPA